MFVFLVVNSCGYSDSQQAQSRDDVELDQKYMSGQSLFASELFQQIFEEKGMNENMFISPYSIILALLMTANGIEESGRQELLDSLHMEAADIEVLNEQVEKQLQSLDALEHAQLNTANSVWHRSGLEVEDLYESILDTYYNGDIEEFDEQDGADTMNQWVTDKTEGHINKMMDEIPQTALAYILNAVYFNANWKHEFNENDTQKHAFHLLNEETHNHEMMKVQEEFEILIGENMQGLKLPYEDDGLSMIIVLPDEGEFEVVAQSLNKELFFSDNWNETTVDLILPKLTFSSEYSLLESLQDLGAFQKGYDFSPLFGEGIQADVTDVIHKTYVQIDEEGTEAAAATAVEMTISAVVPELFHVNRPYYFAIIDEKTETILFMGSVIEPVINE
ncbi:serpin family protein [Alkalicoccobacillus plakortidis]|uniref:Serpin domain-containing protein n=1 Tax=Alkalicoccobacillus plakortidis TaxID=444060 RepID=A0ABT0XLC9_9BACI|nr:serpin family protein [Alkalicoccobacillus plakortidis]MCM2676715.1 hypothetical protein [Alkalicoccobacillus plakortidis]